jgi:hypothetical protein
MEDTSYTNKGWVMRTQDLFCLWTMILMIILGLFLPGPAPSLSTRQDLEFTELSKLNRHEVTEEMGYNLRSNHFSVLLVLYHPHEHVFVLPSNKKNMTGTLLVLDRSPLSNNRNDVVNNHSSTSNEKQQSHQSRSYSCAFSCSSSFSTKSARATNRRSRRDYSSSIRNTSWLDAELFPMA